jgi:hypothetical protein
MKKLLLLLLFSFFSTQSLAKVGDVYYCIMNQNTNVTESGVNELELERFKISVGETSFGVFDSHIFYFRLDDIGDQMVSGLEYDSKSEYSEDLKKFIDIETYSGGNQGQTIQYNNGDFYFSDVRPPSIRTVIANCEIF